jgi:hypothetical protein
MLKILLLVTMLFTGVFANADAPTCHTAHGGYCSYLGQVKSIYVNKSNHILIYFDTVAAAGFADAVATEVTQRSAAILPIDEKPEFAKLFYATALAAQASGRPISMQMRNSLSGYMKIDRIWLAQ